MSEKNEIACPACEYERNSRGNPVEQNGEMQCLDCGASWRVLGTNHDNSTESIKPHIAKKPRNRARELASQVTFEENLPTEAKRTQIIQNYKPGMGMMMSCFGAIVFFAAIYLGFNFLTKEKTVVYADRLYIGEIKLEEQVRRNGDKVFTVKGLVSNPTETRKLIPPIAITLRKTNGDEITRWYYNSSLAALKPGAKSRFASTIQYDTPIVAYAEAVFKK